MDLLCKKKTKAEPTAKKRAPKKKKAQFNFAEWKPFIDAELLSSPHFFSKQDRYFVYGLSQKEIPYVVGIDIGTAHLAFSGVNEDRKLTWVCLISQRVDTVHDACQFLTELLWDPQHKKDFFWLRDCKTIRIELQHQVNPSARVVANVLKSLFYARGFATGSPVDVQFVHGNHKYSIVPAWFKDGPERPTEKSGKENKAIRKKMAVEDMHFLFSKWEQREMAHFFIAIDDLDQHHDLADGYLIALRKWFEKSPSKNKRKK